VKAILTGILLLGIYGAAFAQNSAQRVLAAEQQRDALQQSVFNQQANEAIIQRNQQIAAENARIALDNTLNSFPWREIDGVTQRVSVKWCAFSGKILQTSTDGIRVDGEYHSIDVGGGVSFVGTFFVKHYPYQQADETMVPDYSAAMPCSVYTYTTVMGSSCNIESLDFGIPCGVPADIIAAEQRQQLEEATAEKNNKTASLARALAANQSAAAQGDSYGLLRMGERYRDGEGVETNFLKARDYLARAAAAGDLSASNELAALPQP
jgi:TPR repeat protein